MKAGDVAHVVRGLESTGQGIIYIGQSFVIGVGGGSNVTSLIIDRLAGAAIGVDDRRYPVHGVVLKLTGMAVGVGCEFGVGLADHVAGLVINISGWCCRKYRSRYGPVCSIVLIGGFGTDNIAAGRRIAAGAGGGRVTRVNGIPGICW